MTRGLKIGDVDPRDDPELCTLVSDKALAIGGGVLEALLAKPEIRADFVVTSACSYRVQSYFMTKDNPPENNPGSPKGRLDNPILRIASILIAILAIGTLLYSLANSLPIIPVMAGVFFLMLWFLPQLWDWIEYVFSKRPASRWGRFTLNLVLAILMASAFEDILELLTRFARIISWVIRRMF